MNNKLIIALVLSLSAPVLYAADDLEDALGGFDEPTASSTSDLDDALGGFDSATNVDSSDDIANEPDKKLNFSGDVSISSGYSYAHNAPTTGQTDYRGMTKLRLSTRLVADYAINDNWKAKGQVNIAYDPIYAINGRNNYNADTLDTYESEFEINELYAEGSLNDNIDLKIGRQIVVWGKSDSIRVTDVINPLDNREPGLVDIEDLRLPIFISKLSYYTGDWAMNLYAIHEQRAPKEAAVNSEFFPTSVLPFPPTFVFPDINYNSTDLSQTNLAFSIDGRFSGWDLSFYGGKVTDSRWHFTDATKKERQYGLVDMSGIATNFVVSGVLVKAELAYLSNLAYNTTANKKSRVDSLIGVEYMGITDWVFSGEYANRSIQDYEAQMANSPDLAKENTSQLALRASYTFDHDNATVTLLASAIGDGGEQGGFYRLWLDYAVNDNVKVTAGLIDYQPGTNLILNAISNNDRLFVDAKYSF